MKTEIIKGIFSRRMGNPDAGKLICLHGFADSGQMFSALSETILSEQFELIAIDLPGFGVSPRNPTVNSIEDYANAIAQVVAVVSPDNPVGLIGHSIASAIAVAMVQKLAVTPLGVFSIEGNLTEADAYFSGQAADWDSPNAFKEAFSEQIWKAGQNSLDLRRYYAGVVMADAEAMWNLGRDARRVSVKDAIGEAYKSLNIPTLYYWGNATTRSSTQEFVKSNSLSNKQYRVESHWPTVTDPDSTATAIKEFFDRD